MQFLLILIFHWVLMVIKIEHWPQNLIIFKYLSDKFILLFPQMCPQKISWIAPTSLWIRKIRQSSMILCYQGPKCRTQSFLWTRMMWSVPISFPSLIRRPCLHEMPQCHLHSWSFQLNLIVPHRFLRTSWRILLSWLKSRSDSIRCCWRMHSNYCCQKIRLNCSGMHRIQRRPKMYWMLIRLQHCCYFQNYLNLKKILMSHPRMWKILNLARMSFFWRNLCPSMTNSWVCWILLRCFAHSSAWI